MEIEARVREVVYAAIDELNLQLNPERRLSRSPATALFGEEGALDSLGLVNLIAEVEERVEEAFGQVVNLADGELMSGADDPFRDVAALVEHVAGQLRLERR